MLEKRNTQKALDNPNVYQDGSIELVVLGLLAALIVVLAVPLFIDSPQENPDGVEAHSIMRGTTEANINR